jgi:hypothetical protein
MALLHVTQLFTGNVVTANPTFTNVYTVPAGDRVVLRNLQARNLNGGASQTIYVELNAILIFTALLTSGGSSGGSISQNFWVVMNPADVLKIAASTTTGFGVVVSGSLYTI